jgi:hypothetical protein
MQPALAVTPEVADSTIRTVSTPPIMAIDRL